ncbi:amino acid synthesis family protein [Anaerosinus massiliensis]|uniref:amino acid synthesis family protein n=1 Tax=Massilibacillus massiliensis TaxID=1806837 RepID=UPI000A94C93D|nr:amino acid synthesis family protein [Massilibacillus massiliensis]
MKEPEIRKVVTNVEDIYIEGFKKLDKPLRRCVVAAVIKNPYAGSYAEELGELTEIGEYLGAYLTKIAAERLGAEAIESYGKGAIIGVNGELEHGAAILHPKFGKPMRDVLGGGKAIIPSAKKSGGPGTSLDVPLHYKDAAFVRTHYDAMEIRIADAPKGDEIIVAAAFTDGGRPHPRIGGLQVCEIKGEDGLR